MTTAIEHFQHDVPPQDIAFHPLCRVCGGRLVFEHHGGNNYGYRHVLEGPHE